MAGNERVLNEAEQRRLERYKVKCEELESEGYTKTDLTISVAKANVGALYGLIMTVPLLLFIFLDIMELILGDHEFQLVRV